jgi:protein-tyrosine phosphatase
MAGRAGAVEIIPGKLYQRGQFLTWPAAQKRGLLDRMKVDTVVNLWSKVDPDLSSEKLGFTYLCWLTSPSAVPEGADVLVEVVARRLEHGGCALVHCEAGRGRSVWLAARVFSRYTGCGRPAALDHVRQCVPGLKLTAALLEDLK